MEVVDSTAPQQYSQSNWITHPFCIAVSALFFSIADGCLIFMHSGLWLIMIDSVFALLFVTWAIWNGIAAKHRHDARVADVRERRANAEEAEARAKLMQRHVSNADEVKLLIQEARERSANIEVGFKDGSVTNVKIIHAETYLAAQYYQNGIAGQPQKPPMIGSPQKLRAADIHIPTFTESMQAGLIGPGQEKVLVCYELERDEETGDLTGVIEPYQDKLENNCTMLLGGGSKSGKSTLMAHLGAQEAMMNALFYVIDPHLTHPEKSVARKLEALKHAFILPPAMTDAEVRNVLLHAEAEAKARLEGRETPYSGRPIVVIIDEILALFARAQRAPDNEEIQELYRNLALFCRDLGTQYNKYDVNGIFATQYLTKDSFKLPKGVSVDFRDACQNQTLLRLPPNQAQTMRLLEAKELRGVRQLPQGHGYMGFFTGDVIRMASGFVSVQDIAMAGRVVEAAPTSRQFAMSGLPAKSTGPLASNVRFLRRDEEPTQHMNFTRNEFPLDYQNTLEIDSKDLAITRKENALRRDEEPTQTAQKNAKYRLSPEQEKMFLAIYPDVNDNKDEVLKIIGANTAYRAHANELIEKYNLKKRG